MNLYFEVHNFSSLSDHCPISCSLLTTFFVSKTSSLKLESLPAKFVWNKESVDDTYTKQLTSKESQAKFKEFIETPFTDVNSAVDNFNSILFENAKKSAKLIITKKA